ncbi:hypothetical protein ACJQWK_01252 [Exserohilum turcicum]
MSDGWRNAQLLGAKHAKDMGQVPGEKLVDSKQRQQRRRQSMAMESFQDMSDSRSALSWAHCSHGRGGRREPWQNVAWGPDTCPIMCVWIANQQAGRSSER